MSGRTRKSDLRERGQATVEAAFGIPIVFLLVLLLAQPGIVLYDRMVMASAASEACRLLATGEGDEAACVDHSIVYGRLIGHERHIHNDENIFAASDNCRAVMDHIFHGNGERGFLCEKGS